ncbi:unnamed protein product [Enterobius vermicularis]|uniref:Methyltransferase C9orf114 n=1 Tax=Enterobius vermicularis TaxID=51028 RepID=A0A0N4UX23_ENTVE|nr:unnamed protein product [Enterobius vermicularis]
MFSHIGNYYNGNWKGEKPLRDDKSECNFHLARILEYLECPQYLRKGLFPLQKSLSCAGVLNPLDCPHHLRANDFSIPYREGIVLDKPVKKGRGPYCDVGLDKELELEKEIELPPLTRITVELTDINPDAKRYRGQISSPSRIRRVAGIYWGYNVRLARSLSDALKTDPPYDLILGTSERGVPIEKVHLPTAKKSRILVVFGGLSGLEAAVEADEELLSNSPDEIFTHYIKIADGQGSRTIRTEEAVLMTLAILKSRLDFPIASK